MISGEVKGRRFSGNRTPKGGSGGLVIYDVGSDNNSFTGYFTYKLVEPTPQTAIENLERHAQTVSGDPGRAPSLDASLKSGSRPPSHDF